MNINKSVKNNFYFFSLLLGILYIITINAQLFGKYWEEKSFWLEQEEKQEQAYFSFKDCAEYGAYNWWDFIPDFIHSLNGLFFYFTSIFLFVFYVFFPMICILIYKKISFKYFIIVDLFIFLVLGYIYIPPALEGSMLGVIPYCILIPICFFTMLIFRLYQYKKKLI